MKSIVWDSKGLLQIDDLKKVVEVAAESFGSIDAVLTILVTLQRVSF